MTSWENFAKLTFSGFCKFWWLRQFSTKRDVKNLNQQSSLQKRYLVIYEDWGELSACKLSKTTTVMLIINVIIFPSFMSFSSVGSFLVLFLSLSLIAWYFPSEENVFIVNCSLKVSQQHGTQVTPSLETFSLNWKKMFWLSEEKHSENWSGNFADEQPMEKSSWLSPA